MTAAAACTEGEEPNQPIEARTAGAAVADCWDARWRAVADWTTAELPFVSLWRSRRVREVAGAVNVGKVEEGRGKAGRTLRNDSAALAEKAGGAEDYEVRR